MTSKNITLPAIANKHGWKISKHADRTHADYYPTPFCATRALLAHEDFYRNILEPACGYGHISRILKIAGHRVQSSDIVRTCHGTGNTDFFTLSKGRARHDVITNPPYRWARQFVEHALTLVDPKKGKVAMLMQLSFLGSAGRRDWFYKSGLSRVRVFSKSLPYWSEVRNAWHAGGGFLHAWYIWDNATRRKKHFELHLMPVDHTHGVDCWDFKTLISRKRR